MYFKKLVVVLVGVLALQSCKQYRIVGYTIGDQKYYIAEKRKDLGWVEIEGTVTDYGGALNTINRHRSSTQIKKEIIKIK